MNDERQGILYVVATPIGNLADISQRALDVLARVDRVAAEDTRHSGRLLSHFGLNKPLLALHEHNETAMIQRIIGWLGAGESLALISDAGTPLISDPGFKLVRAVRAAGFRVSPIPGPSAVIAALSVAGLPTDRFVFEGFLPSRATARRSRLQALAGDPRTVIFYESSHRIRDSLNDMLTLFGATRQAVIARELTKLYEEVADGSLADLVDWLAADDNHCKGEFVVMVAGAEPVAETDLNAEDRQLLQLLAAELPPKKAAALAARIRGKKKALFYDWLVGKE